MSAIMIFQLLSGDMGPTQFVALLIALVFGISFHEFAHAAAATWLGDSTPGRQGRLTLQPAAHLEVMGSLMFLIAGFGWGKPVQYNPYALRGNPRTGQAIIAAAGPFTNFILALVVAILTRIAIFVLDTRAGFLLPSSPERTLIELLAWIVYFNLVLSFFNLIPIFPLDGFTILSGILPAQLAEFFDATRQYGFFILMLLFFAGSSLLGPLLYQPLSTLWRLLIGL